MITSSLEDLHLSASALKCYDTCKLKFRRRYIDGLYWPSEWVTDEEKQNIYKLGQLFHTLAQRYYTLGEIKDSKEVIDREDTRLIGWLENLISFRPYTKPGDFYPEQTVRLNNPLRLLAKFDLLYISKAGQAVIYDWKTNKQRLKQEYWENSYQTLVYRYVLKEAEEKFAPQGSWRAEEITLTYWNPRYPEGELELYYDKKQYKRDKERLENLITEINDRDYDEFYGIDDKHCLYCEYRPLCHGQETLELERDIEEDIDIDFEWEELDELQI